MLKLSYLIMHDSWNAICMLYYISLKRKCPALQYWKPISIFETIGNSRLEVDDDVRLEGLNTYFEVDILVFLCSSCMLF